VCGTPFPGSTGRGRPRIYCGDVCRWKAGHEAAAERHAEQVAERADWPFDDLLAWADTQDFHEPY
jgi:hypothetical protein